MTKLIIYFIVYIFKIGRKSICNKCMLWRMMGFKLDYEISNRNNLVIERKFKTKIYIIVVKTSHSIISHSKIGWKDWKTKKIKSFWQWMKMGWIGSWIWGRSTERERGGYQDLHHAQLLTYTSPTRLSVVLLKEVRSPFL